MKLFEKKITREIYRFEIWINQKSLLSFIFGGLMGITQIIGVCGAVLGFVFTIELALWANESFAPISEMMNQGRLLFISSLIKLCGPLNMAGVLLVYSALILLSIFCLTVFFILVASERFTEKLSEVAVPKAKEMLKKYPEAERILLLFIEEAERIDDGEKLAKILKKFNELQNLDIEMECLTKKRKKITEEIAK